MRAALERGYLVNGTLRNKNLSSKSKYLKQLAGGERLTLFDAEMADGASFETPLRGADAVFIACLIPTYKGPSGMLAVEMDVERGYAEIIKPTVDGCLNILRSAQRNGVRNVVICSSTSSTNPSTPVPFKYEAEHWSDENEQCRVKKYTSATKTIMEKAAIKFAEENDIRLSIILPTGLYGEAVLPEHMRHNPFAWLARAIDGGNPHHEKMPNSSVSMIHLRDLANLFLAAYENHNASGRYFGVWGSLHWKDIYAECHKIYRICGCRTQLRSQQWFRLVSISAAVIVWELILEISRLSCGRRLSGFSLSRFNKRTTVDLFRRYFFEFGKSFWPEGRA